MVIRARSIDRSPEGATPCAATLQFLRASEVCALLRISRPTLWRLRRDREFPAPTSLSRRSIGWRQSEVEQWLDSRTTQDPKPGHRDAAASLARPLQRTPRQPDTNETSRQPAGTRHPTRPRRGSQLDMSFGRDPAR
jgi:prophage regulatory protein